MKENKEEVNQKGFGLQKTKRKSLRKCAVSIKTKRMSLRMAWKTEEVT